MRQRFARRSIISVSLLAAATAASVSPSIVGAAVVPKLTPPHAVTVLATRLGLEVTSSRQQADAISTRFGLRALWLFNYGTGRFQSLANIHGPVETFIYATKVHVRSVSGKTVAATSSAPAPRSTTSAVVPSSLTVPSGYSALDPEFDNIATGSKINTSSWNPFITSRAADGYPWNTNNAGGSSSANPTVDYDEEYYLPSGVSAHDGVLDLRATNKATAGMLGTAAHTYPFSSGALSTYGHFEFTGGYVEVRAKMPSGSGMWPGIWMLPGPGSSDGDNYEIDLFEGGMDDAGASPATTFAWHVHSGSSVVGEDSNVGTNLTTAFHNYGLQWIPGRSLTWYLDGRVIGQVTSAQASIPDEPMELILTLQVADAQAAGWHTVPNASTPTVNNMLISGVEVYGMHS